MKKKLSILLVIALMIFAFVPALTLAQDDVEETAEETKGTYENLDDLIADLKLNEDLSDLEIETLKIKLTSYEESLNIDTMTSVVDKILTEEIGLGQGFVILRNLEESTADGYPEEKALELMNSYQDQENSGQFAFQTALEMRKLSREGLSEEKYEEFAEDVEAIIQDNDGEFETSEFKQLAAEYRKDAREENREQMRNEGKENSKSASENDLEKGKANNASENALNKSNKEKGNTDSSNMKDKGKEKASNKSANSNGS